MPGTVHGTATIPIFDETGKLVGIETFRRGEVVSDRDARRICVEHPTIVARHNHDHDLCAAMRGGPCTHESHPWNVPKPAEKAPSAPPTSSVTAATLMTSTAPGA